MHIEKVSRYVPVSTPSRSYEGSTVRQMLVSIPRLKWLDDGIDECRYYKHYKPEPAETASPSRPSGKAPSWSARLKGQPLTAQEQRVADVMDKMRIIDISRNMQIAQTTVRGMMARIRAKRAT